MQHLSKRPVSLILAMALMVGIIGVGVMSKAETAELIFGIYLRQETNYTCTL